MRADIPTAWSPAGSRAGCPQTGLSLHSLRCGKCILGWAAKLPLPHLSGWREPPARCGGYCSGSPMRSSASTTRPQNFAWSSFPAT